MNSRELDDMIARIDDLTTEPVMTPPAEEKPAYVGFDEPAAPGLLQRIARWVRR